MKEDILKSPLTLKVAGLLLLAIALVGSIKETGKGSDTFELSSFTFQWILWAKVVERNGGGTSTKARIFPRRFSTFLTFWCKIQCNRNEASLYPRLAVAVSTPGLLDVAVSTPKLFSVTISMLNRLYSDGTVFC